MPDMRLTLIFTSLILVVLSLRSEAAIDGPNNLLKGLIIVSFDDNIETAKGNVQCKLDYNRLKAAVQFVANQSVKLKFVAFSDRIKQSGELFDKARALRSDAAQKTAEQYNFMPTLFITGTILELPGGCAATLKGDVKAYANSSTMIPTGSAMDHPIVSIWSNEYWLTGPPGNFSERLIDMSEQIMKEFVNDWTASQ